MATLKEELEGLKSTSEKVRVGLLKCLALRKGDEARLAADELASSWETEMSGAVQVELLRTLRLLWPDTEPRMLRVLCQALNRGGPLAAIATPYLECYALTALPLEEGVRALSSIQKPGPVVVRLLARDCPLDDPRVFDCFERAVRTDRNEEALGILKSKFPDRKDRLVGLAEALIAQRSGSSIHAGRELIKGLSVRDDVGKRVLLQGLLLLDSAPEFKEHARALFAHGVSPAEIGHHLVHSVDQWRQAHEKQKKVFSAWSAVWESVEESQIAGLLDALSRSLRGHKEHPWHRALHEMLLLGRHELPPRLGAGLLQAVRQHLWTDDTPGPLTGDARLDATLLRKRRKVSLDRESLKRILKTSTASDEAVTILSKGEEDPILSSLSNEILERASARGRLWAFAQWGPALLPPPQERIREGRTTPKGREPEVMAAWKKALADGGYFLDSTLAKGIVQAPPEPSLLLLCNGDGGLRFLNSMDPLPAGRVIPLFPSLEFLDADESAHSCAWALVGCVHGKQAPVLPGESLVDLLARTLPGWQWETSFAVRLPVGALPTLFSAGAGA